MTSVDGSEQNESAEWEREQPLRVSTGDADVDRALRELDEALLGDGDAQLEGLTQAHRQLQNRLTGSSDHPEPPGQARPGPR